MTARFRRYLTPVLALGLGSALGRAGWKDQSADSARDATSLSANHAPADVAKSVSSRVPQSAERRHTEMSPESAALAAAWNSLKSGRHACERRRTLQEAIIEKWSAIDPESAIAAVLADAPDPSDSVAFLRRCVRAIDEDEGHVQQMLEKEPFGVDTGRVRRVWLSLRAEREPMETIGLLDQLSPLDRRLAVEQVTGNLFAKGMDDAKREPVWNRLLELRGGPAWENDLWAIAEKIPHILPYGAAQESRDKLLEATDPATLDLRAAIEAQQLLLQEFTEIEVTENLPSLPAEIRDVVLEKWKLHRKPEP